MLGAIRRRKNHPIILLALGFALLAMAAFGTTSRSKTGANSGVAARVNGTPIREDDFHAIYARVFRSRQTNEPSFDRSKAEREDLRRQVLDQLVDVTLLAAEASKAGLVIDDDALAEAIVANENFHVEGRFDRKQYERVLGQLQMTDARFEAQQRTELLSRLISSLVEAPVTSDAELERIFFDEQRKMTLDFIRVPKAAFSARVGTVTQADAEVWEKKEGSSDAIQKYYTQHKSTRYDVAEQACARHIMVRVDKSLPPDIRAEKQKTIEAALAAVRGGMDFAAAAARYSEDANKTRGGDLGCFSAGQTIQQLEDAAFGLAPGGISNIIDTSFGLHVIQLVEKKPPVHRKLDDVRSEIALELARGEKATTLAKESALALHRLAVEKGSLAGATSAYQPGPGESAPTVETTQPFARGRDFIPPIGMAKELAKTAWRLSKEKPFPEGPVDTDAAWIVFQLAKVDEPTKEDFEQARGMLTYRQAMKRREAVAAWTKSLRDKAKIEINPDALVYDDSKRGAR